MNWSLMELLRNQVPFISIINFYSCSQNELLSSKIQNIYDFMSTDRYCMLDLAVYPNPKPTLTLTLAMTTLLTRNKSNPKLQANFTDFS